MLEFQNFKKISHPSKILIEMLSKLSLQFFKGFSSLHPSSNYKKRHCFLEDEKADKESWKWKQLMKKLSKLVEQDPEKLNMSERYHQRQNQVNQCYCIVNPWGRAKSSSSLMVMSTQKEIWSVSNSNRVCDQEIKYVYLKLRKGF